jgi:hypothetical protein
MNMEQEADETVERDILPLRWELWGLANLRGQA